MRIIMISGTTMGLAVFIIIVAVFLMAFLVPPLVSRRRLRNRARHDYRVARGTQHLKLLEGPFAGLQQDIRAKRDAIREVKRELSDLVSDREDLLREALCTHLVSRRLTEVDGIGSRLKRRIMRRCFRGDLQDLRHAERVTGIGATRAAAIRRWVSARENELPRLMKRPFPHKEEIKEEYRAETERLERRLEQKRAALREKEAIHKPAKSTVATLSSVKVSHFEKVWRQKGSDASIPNWYFEGVYPAWETAPDWFKTLLDEYGD